MIDRQKVNLLSCKKDYYIQFIKYVVIAFRVCFAAFGLYKKIQ